MILSASKTRTRPWVTQSRKLGENPYVGSLVTSASSPVTCEHVALAAAKRQTVTVTGWIGREGTVHHKGSEQGLIP